MNLSNGPAAATDENPAAFHYRGIIEASAAATLDDRHFLVASDETNTLKLYRRNRADPLKGLNLFRFIGRRKSDIEASAAIGDLIYWIGSHSRKEEKHPDGKRKHGGAKKRSVLFATRVTGKGALCRVKGVGKPFTMLRKAIRDSTTIDSTSINIEGLAATPKGGLLIGFRSPLQATSNHALVLTLENPYDVVFEGHTPRLRGLRSLDLGGLGIRSIDRIDTPMGCYLIMAGPVSDKGKAFALYAWDGGGDTPRKIQDLKIDGFKPEALVTYPGKRLIQVISDDGVSAWNDGNTRRRNRRFRSIDIVLPETL